MEDQVGSPPRVTQDGAIREVAGVWMVLAWMEVARLSGATMAWEDVLEAARSARLEDGCRAGW